MQLRNLSSQESPLHNVKKMKRKKVVALSWPLHHKTGFPLVYFYALLMCPEILLVFSTVFIEFVLLFIFEKVYNVFL